MTAPVLGYLCMPAVHNDTLVFISEDDLWVVPLGGGRARRLTQSRGEVSHPRISPDGQWVAYASHDEGTADVWVMPVNGGPATRLTWVGSGCRPLGWHPDGSTVRFGTSLGEPSSHLIMAHEVAVTGGEPSPLSLGHLVWLDERPDGGRLLGRHSDDLARWKRYRGGRSGVIWVDQDGNNDWRKLALGPAQACPLWHGERVLFLSDHTGHANVWSSTVTGEDLRQHSHRQVFFARHPAIDGDNLVYAAGARLWHVDLSSGVEREIAVDLASPRTQLARRFVTGANHLEDFDLHPKDHSVALTTRGRAWEMGLWEGPVLRPGSDNGARSRLVRYIDDRTLLLVSDAGGEEALEVHDLTGVEPVRRLASTAAMGRALDLEVAPDGGHAAFSNHRQELVLVDLASGESRVLDHSPSGRLAGLAWSPDSAWLAYSLMETQQSWSIKLAEIATGALSAVTRQEFRDTQPVFDPKGRYLYFLSARDFDPVVDLLTFNYAFGPGMRVCLVTLAADTISPLQPLPRTLKKSKKNGDENSNDDSEAIHIDVEGLPDRVVCLPIAAGSYQSLSAIGDRVLYVQNPIKGVRNRSWRESYQPADNTLKAYDLVELQEKTLLSGVSSVRPGRSGKHLLVQVAKKLRVVSATADKLDRTETKTGRGTGLINLHRIPVEVDPGAEWAQMFRETWRLMRDHFWLPNMSGVDWQACWDRYAAVLPRVGCRSEWGDLVWELHGELGTSHAYEMMGDHRSPPAWAPGRLAARIGPGAIIQAIADGDVWSDTEGSPLARPGIDIQVGDRVLAVDGQPLPSGQPLASALVKRAGREVQLTVQRGDEETPRHVVVKTLRGSAPAWYRHWVRTNRKAVHQATEGRCGYIHIPDMGPNGFSEFHRAYMAELDRLGLIVDIRYNRGGHVSTLLMDRLSRKVTGWSSQRWGTPRPYPRYSHRGPLVCITNQFSGSDGDIFGNAFKQGGLGPLIGERSWGGVIGIWPRHRLADGTITTQPEFSGWYSNVGWGLENHGTDPDEVVAYTPADYAAGRDPQLIRAIELADAAVASRGPIPPELGPSPDLGGFPSGTPRGGIPK
jgi:tricorn protease